MGFVLFLFYFIIDFPSVFKHLMFVAIHKHYTLDDWKTFAKENPQVIPVRCI